MLNKKFKVFPCAGKVPATKNGFKDAKENYYKEGFNIGLPTGNINNIVVIDFDTKDLPVDVLIEKINDIGKLPETLTVETPSGGMHFYYRVENTNIQSKTRFFDKNLSVDIRANGGYVIAPPSENYVLNDYDSIDWNNMADLPNWIENYKQETKQNQELIVQMPDGYIENLRKALFYCDADDYDNWIKTGQALKSLNNEQIGKGLFLEFSMQSEKYDMQQAVKKWNSFKPEKITDASIFFEAKKNGFIQAPVQIQKENEINKTEEIKKPEIPAEIFEMPGILKHVFDWVNKSAIRPQPFFAVASTLAIMGNLCARIYKSRDVKSNLYILTVGKSGCGKEHGRSVIKEVFERIDKIDMASTEDVTSEAAIMSALQIEPSQILLFDEFGRFLRTTKSENKNPHLYSVISLLLKMINVNGIFHGKRYADKSKNIDFHNPAITLFGSTTPETLYDSLTTTNISDGFLSRIMIFETDEGRPLIQRDRINVDCPEELVEFFKDILDFHNELQIRNTKGNLDKSVYFYDVPITKEAENILLDFDDFCSVLINDSKDEYTNVFNRTSFVARKVALICAIARNNRQPEINENDCKYAITLCKYLSDYMLYVAHMHVAGSQKESDQKKIYHIIKNNPGISKSELTRKTQKLKSFERNEIIDELQTANLIYVEITNKGTKYHA